MACTTVVLFSLTIAMTMVQGDNNEKIKFPQHPIYANLIAENAQFATMAEIVYALAENLEKITQANSTMATEAQAYQNVCVAYISFALLLVLFGMKLYKILLRVWEAGRTVPINTPTE